MPAQLFSKLSGALEAVPLWIPIILLPALALTFSVLAIVFRLRRWAFPVLLFFGGVGVALLSGHAPLALFYGGCYVAFAALLLLMLFAPKPKKRKKKSREEREEELFKRLCAKSATTPKDTPAKVCRYEEPAVTVQECGMRLSHAEELLKKLKACNLAPSDRLETEVLGHTIDGCRGKPLSEQEVRRLNDCLASVLKLTAKYKL